MPLFFDGMWDIPGIQSALQTTENQVWWGLKEQQTVFAGVIDGSSTDAGDTPTDLVRAGMIMGQVAATGKWKPWSPTATDGTQFAKAVMLYDQKMTDQGTATDRWFGYLLVKGNIKASSLLIGGNASLSIVGDANEFLIRCALKNKFLFDDDLSFDFNMAALQAKTANYNVKTADNGTFFTTLGAAGEVDFTLPAPQAGLRYTFFNAVGQTMKVLSAAAGQLITFNNAAASSVTFSTAGSLIGACVEVVAISNAKWAVNNRGANTMTVA